MQIKVVLELMQRISSNKSTDSTARRISVEIVREQWMKSISTHRKNKKHNQRKRPQILRQNSLLIRNISIKSDRIMVIEIMSRTLIVQ